MRNRLIALRLDLGYILVAVTVGIVTWTLTTLARLTDTTVWAVTVALMLLCVIQLRGSTIPEWLRRTRQVKKRLLPIDLTVRDGAAVGWDWRTASAHAWVEISPAGPYTITTVDDNGNTSTPTVDLDMIADMMHQDDIICSRMQLLTLGMRTAVDNAPARIETQIMGNLPTHASGRTILELTIRLEDSNQAAAARAIHNSHVIGIQKTVLAAAARIVIRLKAQNLDAWILGPEAVRNLARDTITTLGGAGDQPTWKKCGGVADTPAVITAVPTGRWSIGQQREWVDGVQARRTIENTIIERGRDGAARLSYAATFVSNDADNDVPTLTKSVGLSPVGGQQVQALSRTIPIAANDDLDTPWLKLEDDLPVEVHPGGLGVYIGSSRKTGKVFVNVSGYNDPPLWVCGPVLLARQFVLRLSMTHTSIDVRLPDPAGHWRRFVDRCDNPDVTYHSNDQASVMVVTPADVARVPAGKTCIVVAGDVPTPPPAHCIVAGEDGSLTVVSGRDAVSVAWEMPEGERLLLDDTH